MNTLVMTCVLLHLTTISYGVASTQTSCTPTFSYTGALNVTSLGDGVFKDSFDSVTQPTASEKKS